MDKLVDHIVFSKASFTAPDPSDGPLYGPVGTGDLVHHEQAPAHKSESAPRSFSERIGDAVPGQLMFMVSSFQRMLRSNSAA